MPGRPRTTIRNIQEIEDQVGCLASRLLALVPGQYQENKLKSDVRNNAWNNAMWMLMMAEDALRLLRTVIAEFAGIDPNLAVRPAAEEKSPELIPEETTSEA